MKKNKKKVLAILGIAAVMLVGATLAYFTDSETVKNIFTMGKVDIEVEESMKEDPEDPNSPEVPYEDPTEVKPGQLISKMPKITVMSDSLPAYVRAIVKITSPTDADKTVTLDSIKYDKTLWNAVPTGNENEYYFYYKDIVEAGTTVTVFESVTIPKEWTSAVADATVVVDVTGQAIQAEGFEPTIENGMITAWPESGEIVEYKAK